MAPILAAAIPKVLSWPDAMGLGSLCCEFPALQKDLVIAGFNTPLSLFFIYLFLFFGRAVQHMGNLSSRLGIGPMPPSVEARSFNHWTTREVPTEFISQCLTVEWLAACPIPYNSPEACCPHLVQRK